MLELGAGLSFETLRRSGLSYAQAASGDVWTDYNIHDPGVTILEQYCYALTELLYRSDFPVSDLLATEQVRDTGKVPPRSSQQFPIELNRFGLQSRESLDRHLPITSSTLREQVIAGIKWLDDVFVVPVHQDGVNGYNLYVAPEHPDFTQHCLSEVYQSFFRHRNLGETLFEIKPVDIVHLYIEADIFSRSDEAPDRIAAEIFKEADRYVRGEGRSAGSEFQLPSNRGLYNHLLKSSAVSGIDTLKIRAVENRQSSSVDPETGVVFRLDVSDTLSKGTLRLFKGQTLLELDAKLVREVLLERSSSWQSSAEKARRDRASELVVGRARQFSYTPLKSTFPNVYQSNGSLRRRLKRSLDGGGNRSVASQLDAYLEIGDNLGAKVTKQLKRVSDIFALDADEETHSHRAKAVEYLLGLNGYGGDGAAPIVRNSSKADMLSAVAGQVYRDSRGECLTAPYETGASGFEAALRVQLGLGSRSNVSASSAYAELGIHHQENWTIPSHYRITRASFPVTEDALDSFVPWGDYGGANIGAMSRDDAVELCKFTRFLQDFELDERVVRRGLDPDAYLLGCDKRNRSWLFLDLDDDDGVLVCTLRTGQMNREGAISHAYRLRHFFETLDRASEDLYVIEDCLLRPAGVLRSGEPVDHSVFVVFPDWSTRFSDLGFRQSIQQIVEDLLPAHMTAKLLFFDQATMEFFERVYFEWREVWAHATERRDGFGDFALASKSSQLRKLLYQGGVS